MRSGDVKWKKKDKMSLMAALDRLQVVPVEGRASLRRQKVGARWAPGGHLLAAASPEQPLGGSTAAAAQPSQCPRERWKDQWRTIAVEARYREHNGSLTLENKLNAHDGDLSAISED